MLLMIWVSIFIFPENASANVGYPMIVLVWPALWALIIPIILIEGIIAIWVLKMNFWNAIKLAARANIKSALTGVPIVWIMMAVFEFVGFGIVKPEGLYPQMSEHATWELPSRLVLTILGSPWLLPMGNSVYLNIYARVSALMLCIPFFLASVWFEGKSAVGVLGNNKSRLAWRWAWIGNAVTYFLIIITLSWMVHSEWNKIQTAHRAILPVDSRDFKSPDGRFSLVPLFAKSKDTPSGVRPVVWTAVTPNREWA
jgi:hypothetical protein